MKAKKGQSVFDFILQHTGSIDSALAFCEMNNISNINDDLDNNIDYLLPEVSNSKVSEFYTKSGIQIASNINFSDYDSFSSDFSSDFS